MAKTDKELVAELTMSFISSWNSKPNTSSIKIDDAKDVFNSFKELVASMDEHE